MTITKVAPHFLYSSMKKKQLRRIRLIFDIENDFEFRILLFATFDSKRIERPKSFLRPFL